MTSPTVADVDPRRSERARSLRRKPSSAIASVTRAAVCGATLASSLMTRDTVFKLTPARSATWRIVGRAPPRTGTAGRPPPSRDNVGDNVVRSLLRGPAGWQAGRAARGAARAGLCPPPLRAGAIGCGNRAVGLV